MLLQTAVSMGDAVTDCSAVGGVVIRTDMNGMTAVTAPPDQHEKGCLHLHGYNNGLKKMPLSTMATTLY